jgi:hypothetical protein
MGFPGQVARHCVKWSMKASRLESHTDNPHKIRRIPLEPRGSDRIDIEDAVLGGE